MGSVEVGATEEVSALRTDQFAVVLLQGGRAVGTNLRGFHRGVVGGFHRRFGVEHAIRVLTCAVRHVRTEV